MTVKYFRSNGFKRRRPILVKNFLDYCDGMDVNYLQIFHMYSWFISKPIWITLRLFKVSSADWQNSGKIGISKRINLFLNEFRVAVIGRSRLIIKMDSSTSLMVLSQRNIVWDIWDILGYKPYKFQHIMRFIF